MSLPRVGLTGGIGSGKSTVAAMFAGLGVPVLDLDRVGHDVAGPGSTGLQQLVQQFGPDILHADGTLNRKLLGQRCFADTAATKQLNAIMHPLIWQAEAAWLQQQQGAYALIEASVLLESGGAQRMDAVIVVLAEYTLRCQRVLARGRQSQGAFEAIAARQCSDEERRAAADFIISNNADRSALLLQVEQIHRSLLQRFEAGQGSV